jgi:hypothetical protein
VPLLLLKVHKIVWEKTGLPSFLRKGDIPANCLADLNIEKNELSLWFIEDSRANLNRVLTTLAASCNFVSDFDYLLFDENIVTNIGLTINKTDGGTPDNLANRSWHRDLSKLSAQDVLKFAVAIFFQSIAQRIKAKKIEELLKAAVANGEVDSLKLTPRMAQKLAAPSAGRVRRFLRMCQQIGSAIGNAWQEFRSE